MVRKEEILARTSNGLDVFKYYLPVKWRVGRNFLNPLYEDHKASCNVYYDRRSGTYKMKDFGNGDFSGDCFFLVAKIKGLECKNAADFVEILETIDRDLCLGIGGDVPPDTVREVRGKVQREATTATPTEESGTAEPTEPSERTTEPERKPRPYQTVQQPFREKELAYWAEYGITEEVLSRYGVQSLKEYRSETKEGKAFGFTSTLIEPMYGYAGKWGVKVYRPKSEIRFVYGGHTGENYCFGLEQLPPKGDTLFLTGGEKDVLTLAAHGFHAICFNSETSVIPTKIIRKLVYRFKHIVLLYDVDRTGLECSEKHRQQLTEYGVKRMVLPLTGNKTDKDVSDYFKAGRTRDEFVKLFLKLLETLYGDTMAVLKSCEIDYDHPPQQAVAIVTAGDVPLGSEENILCITGGEGTGKSNYTAALVAGAIQEKETDADLLGVRVEPNRKGRAVLLYDTEQSEQQLYKNTGRMLRRAGREKMPEFLHVYCLTGMSRSERLTAIMQSMDKYHYLHGGIHLVVIDGVADLIRCANDEGESVALIDEIYRLAGIYRTCIAAVVHFVPNGLKLRGHLGSELQRKSAAILSIEKDENPEVSVVKALKVREGSPLDIPLMQFRWDKQMGMPVYVGEKPRAEKEKRKEKELAEMAREAFTRQEKYGYIELCELIQEMLEVKERTAKGYIRYMREKEIIEKEGDCYVHRQGRV
uniref:bifunctional DNA primase/helicase n=2 Tax=uncultured Bacteroides sp. TaxID=162156 RepID=UPI0025CF9F02|nr:bifunctional DNA primase/helicase [uncultured Bacteroides sp.]